MNWEWQDWEFAITLFGFGVVTVWAIGMLVHAACWVVSHVREFNALQERDSRRRWRRRVGKPMGYINNFHAMEMTKTFAAMFGVDPLTQSEEFLKICEACHGEFRRYEMKAAAMRKRPVDGELDLSEHIG